MACAHGISASSIELSAFEQLEDQLYEQRARNRAGCQGAAVQVRVCSGRTLAGLAAWQDTAIRLYDVQTRAELSLHRGEGWVAGAGAGEDAEAPAGSRTRLLRPSF